MIAGLDREKVGAIAAAALEGRPEPAKLLGRSVGSMTGWRIRGDRIEGEQIVISVRSVRNGATTPSPWCRVPKATLDEAAVTQ